MSSRVRFSITFAGRVQGVGFRATTRMVASRFAVTGWVRNEPDGTVRCVAEGREDELRRFLDAIKEAMVENVRRVDVTLAEATDEFPTFDIQRH